MSASSIASLRLIPCDTTGEPRSHLFGDAAAEQLEIEREMRVRRIAEDLTALPVIETALLKKMRSEIRRVKKLQDNVKFSQKTATWHDAHSRMWGTFHALHWRKVVTPAGAVALLDLAGLIMASQAMRLSTVPEMVALARSILAGKLQ